MLYGNDYGDSVDNNGQGIVMVTASGHCVDAHGLFTLQFNFASGPNENHCIIYELYCAE